MDGEKGIWGDRAIPSPPAHCGRFVQIKRLSLQSRPQYARREVKDDTYSETLPHHPPVAMLGVCTDGECTTADLTILCLRFSIPLGKMTSVILLKKIQFYPSRLVWKTLRAGGVFVIIYRTDVLEAAHTSPLLARRGIGFHPHIVNFK